ncbi:hypothetical protein OAE48_04175 [Flavobacteriales bacterium]|nr:hypothetical protein [Flavobacteriales bacterium]
MRKVSLGFKGDPYLKLELKDEAEESEMTVSEYLEAIVESRHMKDDVRMLRFRLKEEQRAKQAVLSRLEDYENSLDRHFKAFKGQELRCQTDDGNVVLRKIHTKLDMLECFLTSIKTK